MKIKNWIIFSILFLVVFDAFVWFEILFRGANKDARVYFLDVGQGDSELVVLPGGVKVLIDGGPTNQVINVLASVLSPFDRYIDLVMLSHAQTDHFTGLIDVFRRYQVGAFVYNGRDGSAPSWPELAQIVNKEKVPVEVLLAGDKIVNSNSQFDILMPDKNFIQSADLNETALVALLQSQNSKILFTGDMDSKIEDYLVQRYNLNIDVLKVAHHGSKFSSDENFLQASKPKIAVIEVGKNSYGHPTQEALSRLSSVGAQIFRTDQNGTIKLAIENSKISVFRKK